MYSVFKNVELALHCLRPKLLAPVSFSPLIGTQEIDRPWEQTFALTAAFLALTRDGLLQKMPYEKCSYDTMGLMSAMPFHFVSNSGGECAPPFS